MDSHLRGNDFSLSSTFEINLILGTTVKTRIGILLLSTVIAAGCATHPRLESPKTDYSASLDSARTLIRRGMIDEAQKILGEPRQFTDMRVFAEFGELAAKTFEKQEKWSDAAANYRSLARMHPDSLRYRVAYWKDLAAWWMQDSTKKDSLQAEIRRDGENYATGSKLSDYYLSYMSAAFLGDSTAEARSDKLCEMFPTSDEATEIIGGKFWDGLYPIWENDSAKVPYFKNFITKYYANSWANYGYRNLSLTLLALKDTAGAVQAACDWTARAPNHPNMLSGAGGYMLDLPQGKDSAIVWIERAYVHQAEVVRPPHVTPEEWSLYEKLTKASIPLLMAELRMRNGKPAEAKKYAEESLALADYDLDDNNTPAPQYLMLGRIALAMGDSAKAAEYWVKAAIEGDVYNRFAGRAVDSLKAMIGLNTGGTETKLIDYCRKVAGYEGITFDRVTAEVGLDSARGGRVAWGDYENDSYDDLLAGGSKLYLNNWSNYRKIPDILRHHSNNLATSYPTGLDDSAKYVEELDTIHASSFFDVTVLDDNDPHYDKAMFYSAPYLPFEYRGACHGGVWNDYDNDGDMDIFGFSSGSDVANSERLFRNLTFENKALAVLKNQRLDVHNHDYWLDKAGQFRKDSQLTKSVYGYGLGSTLPLLLDITSYQPFLPDSFSTESAIWFDANGDGLLDLYIPGYERPAKDANDLGNAWPSRLMVQGADGVFRDSTEAFGIGKIKGRWLCGRSPVACDFDRDGDQDLYVGNYRLQENQFWINGKGKLEKGNPTDPQSEIRNPQFTNMAAYYGMDGEEHDGWWGHTIGCEWGDFDGDGDFDLIACNLAHPRYIGFSNRTMLYRNDLDKEERGKKKEEIGGMIPNSKFQIPNSALPFTDVRREWGIKYEECHSEPNWGDFDNDGDLDLFITCVYPNRRSFLYENKGDHFEDVTFLSGVRIFNGWGCATSDYDNDGRLDLAACEGGKIELFRNITKNDNNWIEIQPDIRPGVHLSQIGGIVEVEAGGRKIIRQFEGGKGAGSQNSGTLHFGLGKATVCKMTVSNYGRSEYFKDMKANQRFEILKKTVLIRAH